MTRQDVTVEACVDASPESVFSASVDPHKPFLALNPLTITTVTAVCTVVEPPLLSVMLLAEKASWASASMPMASRFNCRAKRCRGNGSITRCEPSRCKQ